MEEQDTSRSYRGGEHGRSRQLHRCSDEALQTVASGIDEEESALFDDLNLRYTMVKERDVHLKLCAHFQFICKPATSVSEKCNADAEDAIFL
jgi:hypothetical protein